MSRMTRQCSLHTSHTVEKELELSSVEKEVELSSAVAGMHDQLKVKG